MSPRLKKSLIYAFLTYTILGFIVLPLVLKSQLIKIIEEKSESKVTIESLYFNPFLFKLEMDGVTLSSLKNEPLLSFESLSVNVNPSSLFGGAIHLKELLLKDPKVYILYTHDKKINLLTIIKNEEDTIEDVKEEDTQEESSFTPRFIINKIIVSNGTLLYKDLTQKSPFEFSFHKIGFSLKDIDTDDVNNSDATLRFYSTLGDGGFVDFNSHIRGFSPLKVDGTLLFEASKLYTEWKYIREQLKLEVADGKVSFSTDFALNVDDLNATLLDNLSLKIEKLRIKPKDKAEDILNLEELDIRDVVIKPMMQDIKVPKLSLNNLVIGIKRDKEGAIDWLEYIKREGNLTKEHQEKDEQNVSTPWHLLVEDIALKNMAFQFDDAKIEPEVSSKINNFNLFMQDVTLLGEKPLSYQLDMLLNQKAILKASGEIEHKELNISSQLLFEGLNVAEYKPYINAEAKKIFSPFNIDLKSLEFGMKLDAHIYKEGEDIVVNLQDSNISLKKLRVDKRSTKEKLITWKSLNIEGISLNTKSKKVSVDSVQVSDAKLKARKYKNGKFSFEKLVVAKKSQKQTTQKEKAFDVTLKHFALRNMGLVFADDALSKRATNRVHKMSLDAYNIQTKKGSWIKYNTSLRFNSKGYVKANGKLRVTPLQQQGNFSVKNISLEDINPYIQETLYARIDDGKVSLKGTTEFHPSSKGVDLRVQSSFQLDSLFVSDARDDSLLLSLQEVNTDSFTLELAPNRFYINELDINSFYLNAMINEKKELNFAQLSKKVKKEEKMEVKKEGDAFPYQIAKINVASGSAKFADYSIPIKFKTDIHDLDGVIYSISNLENGTSYINISGEVDKYGSTRLKGSIDSAEPKNFTDLSFNFQNLNLNSLSGYSASFAGYKIDEGKLFLDLDYNIVNSELLGKNSVMLKRVELGDVVEDENITVLPLGFVLGLLEDSDGIVDLNMDVAGNVDAPDFKYGPLVLKTFTNLITKAVTSPFKFLGSVMGFDAEKLENLDFEAGSFTITPPEREKLDQIAKIMLKKPKITLNIVPSYNKVNDKKALQLHKLVDLVMQKSGLKNRKEHESAMSIALLENIYEEMREDDALEKLQEKLHIEVSDEKYERTYQSALISLCRDIQPIQTMELQSLAKERAESIFSYLTAEKFISKSRISSKKVSVDDADDAKMIQTKMEIKVE